MEIVNLLEAFVVNLFITVAAYLTIPAILCLLRIEFSPKQIKWIVGINGFCVWLLFMIVRITNGEDGTSAAVILWSGVAYWMMNKFCHIDDSEGSSREDNNKRYELILRTLYIIFLFLVLMVAFVIILRFYL